MIVPNKFTSLDESILGIMNKLVVDGVDEITVQDLLKIKRKYFSDISEFVMALDALYTLGRIEMDDDTGIIRYVS